MPRGQVEKCIEFDTKNTTNRDRRAGTKPCTAAKGG
jgi:hypothetical protein